MADFIKPISKMDEKIAVTDTEPIQVSAAVEKIYTASQTQLVLSRLFKHKLAILGMVILVVFYITAIFAPFLTINDPLAYFDAYTYTPPQMFRFVD